MTLTYREIEGLVKAISMLNADVPMRAAAAFRLHRFRTLLEPPYASFETAKRELVERFMERDEQGAMRPKEGVDMALADAEYDELLRVSENLELPVFSPSDFDAHQLPVRFFELMQPVIREE